MALDGVDLQQFYKTKETITDYGERKSVEEFYKMSCCNGICDMDDKNLKEILKN